MKSMQILTQRQRDELVRMIAFRKNVNDQTEGRLTMGDGFQIGIAYPGNANEAKRYLKQELIRYVCDQDAHPLPIAEIDARIAAKGK